MIAILLTKDCDLGLEAASRDTAQDDIGCAGLRGIPQSVVERGPRPAATTKPRRSGGDWGGFQAHIQDRDHETDAGAVRPERGGIDKVAERRACAYSTQIGGRGRSGQHSGDAVGGSQADERGGRLAQGAGKVGRTEFVGSESDIELVAVSYKFDFSERRNLPNKEMDPDHKLPKGFWGPPSFSPVHFLFPFSPSVGNT